MRGPALEQMNAFAEVAERRSFAKAATALGVSPSTLSETIRTLEERLGVRLLNRTTRSVAPTEAGERLLLQLRPLLADFSAVVDSVSAFRDKPAGLIRLTVPPPAASFVLAPLLRQFLEAYPDIRLEISVDATRVDIIADRYDAGIRLGNRIDKDMIAIRVSEPMRHVVVASPAYLAGRNAPKTPHELASHNGILARMPSGVTLPWRFAEKGKSFDVTPLDTLALNDPDMAARAAIDGVGVLYTIGCYVKDALADGRLVPLLVDWLPNETEGFFLYYPSRRHVPAPLQALVGFLRAQLKDGILKDGILKTEKRPLKKAAR